MRLGALGARVFNSRQMSLVEVKLLGPVALAVDGRPAVVRRRKQRALLALLALHVGEVLSTDRLVDELWGESPPKSAVGSLQNLVSELRRLIGSDVLVTRSPGYLLELDPGLVDAHRFERAVREGTELREALALWRGPALADVADEPFAQAEIGRLEELRAAAREELFAADLALGEHARLVPELEAFVAQHPLRERPRGQLMLALYRSGRQAEALDVYRQTRATLVDELGLEPSAELNELEQAILRHDPSVALGKVAAPASPEPERRKGVTILFADVVDSSELAARLDPEVYSAVMARYYEAVSAAVQRHGGVVEKFIGDAAMAVFGVPTVHEDDALRAARAALEVREAVEEQSSELTEAHGMAVRLRIGVNSGEVVVGDPATGEPFATGSPVHVAMRLEQAALPGEILLGETTSALVGHAVEGEWIDPVDLGPALGRAAAFRLEEVGEAERPLGDAALVGRTSELAWLQAAFAGVQAERRGRVVTVLGDGGVGKSRLAKEFVASTGARALVGRCVSYGQGATFLPLAHIVREAAPERRREAIAQLFVGDEQGPLIAERVAQLAAPAGGTDPTGEVFWAVRRFLEALALERPLVVVLEDIHWAEPTLLDLVEYLDAWTTDAPLLVLCLARKELLDQRPGWATESGVLELEPLTDDESEQLAAELGSEVEGTARTRIVGVAEGNPLFLEHLLAFAEEAGLLAALPPTVEALLAARLDRLAPDERALLERAAVVGRDFSRSALMTLSPPDALPGLDRRLAALTRRGFVRALRGRDEDTHRFRHVLIRDVAYGGVTKSGRSDLHERYGSWLRQRDGRDEIVGYHLEQAHLYRAELQPGDPRLRPLADAAGTHLGAAGMRGWKRADLRAAMNLLSRATSLLERDDADRVELLCELGIARRWSGDAAGSDEALVEALAEADAGGDRRLALRARMELEYGRLFTDPEADPALLLELLDEAIPAFEERADDRALGRAWRLVGYVRGSMEGRCADWMEASERALVHYERSDWSPSGCLAELATALFHGPTPVPAAMARCEQLLEATSDLSGSAGVLVFLGGLRGLAERFDEAFDTLDQADELYSELGETYSLANNSGRIRGRIHHLAGDPEAAEAVFRDCCETFERVNDETALATIAAGLGQALYDQGRYAEAMEWSDLAESRCPKGDIIAQFSWRSLKGKLLARQSETAEGERLVLESLEIVEGTDALCDHGAVLLDLAEVLRIAERHTAAAGRVEEALQFFERKGDTASSQRAKRLFADLTPV
jgi:DNA-binding SARP family transcriptional activator